MNTKLLLEPILLAEITRLCELTIKNDKLYNNNDDVLSVTSCEGITIPVVDDNIDGVIIFGDYTIEFHLLDEDACNWAEFSEDTIKRVISILQTM